MTRIDRRVLFTSGAAAALLSATGISAAPRPGGRLRIALAAADRTSDWTRPAEDLFMQMSGQGAVLDTLTEVAADGTLRGELATSWRVSEDGATWIFDLRQGVQFHDGFPLRAKDVAVSLERHEDLSTRVINEARIEVKPLVPDAGLPLRLSQPVYVIQPAEPERLQAGIGTGLYAVHKFDSGRHFIAHRVARHWKDGQAGWFASVEIVSIPSAMTRAEALQQRYVDVAEITDLPRGEATDYRLLPTESAVLQVARSNVQVPRLVSASAPFDTFRAAERWWFAG